VSPEDTPNDKGRLGVEPPEASPLGNDPSMRTRFVGVRGEGFIGVEVQVALDGKTQRATKFADFAHADEAEFGTAHAQIAETEGDVVVTELGEEPGALGIGSKEFDDGFEVDVGLAVIHADDLRLTVVEELFGLFLSEECH
jgi:hypothetical protein